MPATGIRELMLDVARFRNDTREIVVETIRAADAEVIHRPGAIPGGVGDGSIFAALVHIVDVEESWLREHLLGEGVQDGPDLSRFRDLESTAAVWAEASAAWIAFLNAATGDTLAAPYAPLGGPAVPVWTIAHHVFNHTTHHASEIWTALTVAGCQPPGLDFIAWVSRQSPGA